MEPLFTKDQEAEIRRLLREELSDALTQFFEEKGKLSKNIIITAATIVGSLTVIFGGLKVLLAWLGFSYLVK